MSETTQQPAQKEPAFKILGTIGYDNPADLDNFIATMDEKGGIFVLIQAVNYAQSRGLFNLNEASLIAAAVKKFLVTPKPEEEQLP